MWKLYALGCAYVIISAFGNVDSTFQRFHRKIWPERESLSLVEVIMENGYLGEERFVTTEDGYILALHRIFGGPKSPPAPNKSLVLLIHGMAASSYAWIMRGPKKDLAYLLVDEGFDVWMMNVRGNSYSRRHVKISPNRPEFWKFSWHENGIYDMPATIDYMLAETGQSKVTLIGHSMGSTVAYVLLCMRPEYNEMVDLVVSLAPVAIFTRQFRGPGLTFALQISNEALNSLRRNDILELFPYTPILQLALEPCRSPGTKEICREIIFRVSGISERERFDDSLIPAVLTHFPAGTSLDTLEHYKQNIQYESFRVFDYGEADNYVRYGSAIPPEYPLSKITAPVILYYGLNDSYVQPPDIKALEQRLPNVVASKTVPYRSFNHLDFVISKDAKELLYDDIIDVIKKIKAKETRNFI